jgi:hypothetical protein
MPLRKRNHPRDSPTVEKILQQNIFICRILRTYDINYDISFDRGILAKAGSGLRTRLLVPLAISSVLALSGILFYLQFFRVVIVTASALIVACFFYNLVWLYRKTENYMEGIPSNLLYYTFGFTCFSVGVGLIAFGTLESYVWVLQAGLLVCLSGLCFTVVATGKIFDRILTGTIR